MSQIDKNCVATKEVLFDVCRHLAVFHKTGVAHVKSLLFAAFEIFGEFVVGLI